MTICHDEVDLLHLYKKRHNIIKSWLNAVGVVYAVIIVVLFAVELCTFHGNVNHKVEVIFFWKFSYLPKLYFFVNDPNLCMIFLENRTFTSFLYNKFLPAGFYCK